MGKVVSGKEFEVNKELEEEAKRLGDYPLHKIISKVQQRFGVFNMVRNARNKQQVDLSKIGEE